MIKNIIAPKARGSNKQIVYSREIVRTNPIFVPNRGQTANKRRINM